MKERDIERHLVKRVEAIGGAVRKVQWIGRRNAPDRLVMLPCLNGLIGVMRNGGSVWVELKAPGVKPRVGQLLEHARMRALGQRVVVIDSIEGVETLLA